MSAASGSGSEQTCNNYLKVGRLCGAGFEVQINEGHTSEIVELEERNCDLGSRGKVKTDNTEHKQKTNPS